MIKLAVAGATGRMGRCVLELAARQGDFHIAAALTAPGGAEAGRRLSLGGKEIVTTDQLKADCDVLIDFSLPAGTMSWLAFCERREIPMVIGVTGHDADQLARIQEAAHQIPIVAAANFSVGVHAILDVLGSLVQRLGPGYDIEVVETHHRDKIDAPSGTAKTFICEIRNAERRSADRPQGDAKLPVIEREAASGQIAHGRSGRTGERPEGQIGVHSLRMGDIVGRHEIHFSGCGEIVSIRHEALSRDTFAAGALRAAAWLMGKRAGYYTMHDVLAE